MAANDQGLANNDLQKLKSHLLELKLALSDPPTDRPQKTSEKGPKTSSMSSSDTKDAIIEKVDKASRDLYNKLKEIRARDCTEEDTTQVTSLLKSYIRELDPKHPYLAEPEADSPQGAATDEQDSNEHRNLGEEDDDVRDHDYQDETMRDSDATMESAE
ncbi:Ff.00g004440.m01.CDS01 [Fusarium sp. VM40]|nr:Ff.00g004440.m01.CDS01 [Fusarium sp. VM40]